MSPIAREAGRIVSIALGVAAAGMGLHGFLTPSSLIDGGVTGISMLLERTTGLPIAVLLPLGNLPFVVLGYRRIGRAFAIRSVIAIVALAVVLATIHFPIVTRDRLLSAVFGGLFLGVGIGLAMRGGAVLDGTEIAALLISRRSDLVRVGDVIMGLNVVIFAVAALILGVEPALYSVLTYAAASKTLDFVLNGIEEYTAILIVSSASNTIRGRVTGELGRGVTVLKGEGGHEGALRDILYCVVTRLEVGKVQAIVREEDEAAFVTSHALKVAKGGVLSRRAAH